MDSYIDMIERGFGACAGNCADNQDNQDNQGNQGNQGNRVVRVFYQLEDGSIWEGDAKGFTCCPNYGMPTKEFVSENGRFTLFRTDVLVENFDSIKQIKELLDSSPDDFLEKIIVPETYKPTGLGAKIIRNIVPNEESVNRLYRSLKTIEKKAEWFDVSRLLGYSDVDGDPATLVASMLKESIKGSIKTRNCGLFNLVSVFTFDKEIPKNLKSLIDSIFEGYVTYEAAKEDEQTKDQILKIICFFIDLADLLSNK